MATSGPSAFLFSPNVFSSSSSSGNPKLIHLLRRSSSPRRLAKVAAFPSDPPEKSSPNGGTPDPVRLAFEKSMTYKKAKAPNRDPMQSAVGDSAASAGASSAGGDKVDPVKVSMDKAREYKKSKGVTGGWKGNADQGSRESGQQKTNLVKSNDSITDINTTKEDMIIKKEEPSFSSIDFLGLNFSEKKNNRRTPAGLVPLADPFPPGELPDVEIIVGDASKFQGSKSLETDSNIDENSSLYKPKVSTWGVFPRPDNISKTFGGGRNIRPGEVLETAEVKAAKEAKTKELVAIYKKQIGLSIDAKTKSKCEKALKDGGSFMDKGQLREALTYFEEVMKATSFKSELHGLAALQWSICQDSLSRQDEARIMYEKLQSHPSVKVSSKARQLMFGFQAMEMLKIAGSSPPLVTGYENYFEAFLEEKPSTTEKQADENSFKQVLPYIFFLFSPIIIVLLVVARKGY